MLDTKEKGTPQPTPLSADLCDQTAEGRVLPSPGRRKRGGAAMEDAEGQKENVALCRETCNFALT